MPTNDRSKYNLPPYTFCDGGEASPDGGTKPASGKPGTGQEEKFTLDGKEYTKDELQEAIKIKENKKEWERAYHEKGEKQNREHREAMEKIQQERTEIKQSVKSLEEQIYKLQNPEIDPATLDPDERAAFNQKQKDKKIEALEEQLEAQNKKLDELTARENAREQAKNYGRYREAALEEYAYTEETDLDIESNRLVERIVQSELRHKLHLGLKEDDFKDAYKRARAQVDHYRDIAREQKKAERAGADKTVGAGDAPAPEKPDLVGKSQKERLRLIAKSRGIMVDDRSETTFVD